MLTCHPSFWLYYILWLWHHLPNSDILTPLIIQRQYSLGIHSQAVQQPFTLWHIINRSTPTLTMLLTLHRLNTWNIQSVRSNRSSLDERWNIKQVWLPLIRTSGNALLSHQPLCYFASNHPWLGTSWHVWLTSHVVWKIHFELSFCCDGDCIYREVSNSCLGDLLCVPTTVLHAI